MDRREFLKRAGVGSVALSSLPLLGERAWADSKPRIRESGKIFHFLVLSAVPDTTDRLIIAGDGEFNAFVAEGGGSFDHFKAEGSPPLPLVATGTWTAHEVLRFKPLAKHGVFQAGILVMRATFHPQGKPPVNNVTVKVVCNLGPAGADTGQEEGVTVRFPGPPPVTFEPVMPTVGVTVFSNANEPEC